MYQPIPIELVIFADTGHTFNELKYFLIVSAIHVELGMTNRTSEAM